MSKKEKNKENNMNVNRNSKVPDASELLTIIAGKEYTLISVKKNITQQNSTSIKVKEFTRKFSCEHGQEAEEGFWWHERTVIKGSDITGKKFEISLFAEYSTEEGKSITATVTWLKDSEDEEKQKEKK
jgi:hypothetical protein